MELREPVAAGQFYPSDSVELRKTIEGYFKKTGFDRKASAVVSPHAGYYYSGFLSALSISRLKEAGTIVILGTNHSGLGAEVSVSPHSEWITPLGNVQVNQEKAKEIVKKSSAEFDELAHSAEHSIEVQLPFLQCAFRKFDIVPICVASASFLELLKLGEEIAGLKDCVVVASGDFSHYIPENSAKKKDSEAIKLIEAMKPKDFFTLVRDKHLSICGLAPITALLGYSEKKGLKNGKMLKYTTSAAKTGDYESVVGYASILFE